MTQALGAGKPSGLIKAGQGCLKPSPSCDLHPRGKEVGVTPGRSRAAPRGTLPAGWGSLGMRQGPLPPIAVGFISVCRLAQWGVGYPAAPAQPPCQLRVTLLSPEPTQTAPAPRLGELRGGKKRPLGDERQTGSIAFGWRCRDGKGRLPAAGRQELGKHQGHRSRRSAAAAAPHGAAGVQPRWC